MNPTIEKCHHCGHEKKTWKKSIISSAVAALCKLVNLYNGTALHLDDFIVVNSDRGNGNFSQLVHWKLVTPETNNDDETKRTSGKWHPTQKGIEFALGNIQIPKYILTCENILIEHEEPMIDVEEALNNRFDYSELIRNNSEQERGYVSPENNLSLFFDRREI